MEEMKFLFEHTPYALRCNNSIDNIRSMWNSEWLPLDMYREECQNCRDSVKMDLCVGYLKSDMGLTLSRKWEQCRARAEKITALGIEPRMKTRFIYTGIGKLHLHVGSYSHRMKNHGKKKRLAVVDKAFEMALHS
ncbi:hypothetical protein PRNP1_014609 [Phytophthora ramorum]